MEDALIKLVKNSIRGIKLGSKKPSDVGSDVNKNLNKLKVINVGMAEDLLVEYKNVVEDWKRKNVNN